MRSSTYKTLSDISKSNSAIAAFDTPRHNDIETHPDINKQWI